VAKVSMVPVELRFRSTTLDGSMRTPKSLMVPVPMFSTGTPEGTKMRPPWSAAEPATTRPREREEKVFQERPRSCAKRVPVLVT
jgi:hypothetical protein